MVSLRTLYLSSNELEGGIPKFFGNMCSLNRLFLPQNKLSGELSEMIQNLSGGCTMNSLEGLSLVANDITGPLPDLVGFSSLKTLTLGENRLNGTINKSLSQLLKLESLSLGTNSFTGVISETFFSNMSNLQMLYLNDNSLTLKLSHDWVPPFQLKSLSLASCKMGPHFPKWLQTQNQLISLDVSNNGISDAVPDWFWDLSIELVLLNLSNNQIRGSEHEYKSTLGLVKCLDLSSNKLDGAIPEEIMDLVGLIALNLSRNHLTGPITPKIGELTSLDFLDLSRNLFSGSIPSSLSQLSGLGVLDLSYNNLAALKIEKNRGAGYLTTAVISSRVHWFPQQIKCALPPVNPSFIWHFNLSTSIETLDLSDNNLPSSSVYPWLFNLSRNILYLNLGSNSLRGSIPEAFQHMVSLKSLYLCDSELEGGIPKFFGNMCSLKELGLSDNKLSGQFSQAIQNLSCGCVVNSLEVLYLHDNDFTRPVPLLGGFSSLEELQVDVNRLNGTIDKSLNQLSKLESLSLDGNSFTGVISETFFSNMSNLQELVLADNSFTLKLSHNWVPPFQLKWLSLASCKMGPHFPKWLQTQNQLVHLDISNVGISDTIPDWFWDLSSKLSYLNLSNNHIKGKLPDLSLRFDGTRIGGSENEYKSTLGLVRCLDLSSNKLDGPIPEEIMDLVGLIAVNLSRNNLTGPITPKIGELTSLDFLDLSRNLFSGSIPSSLSQLSGLGVLDLSIVENGSKLF
ncbi:hypothetical protein WN943_027288 [Citrus x changshan-huyou]